MLIGEVGLEHAQHIGEPRRPAEVVDEGAGAERRLTVADRRELAGARQLRVDRGACATAASTEEAPARPPRKK